MDDSPRASTRQTKHHYDSAELPPNYILKKVNLSTKSPIKKDKK